MPRPPRDKRTELSRQATYKHLSARVAALEDAMSHFYNIINRLRERVSMLEEKSKPEDQHSNLNQRRGS
jgi:hypothetical protein